MPNVLEGLVHKGLERIGLKLSKLRNTPIGNDLVLDLARVSPSDRISTIFDVGPNAGRSARKFVAAFPNAKIYSFEPVGTTYRQLVAATEGFPNVRCFHFAMGDVDKSLEIYLQKDSEWNSLAEQPNRKRSAESAEKETIQVRTVDGFCAAEGVTRIDVLKTDTEGFDFEVLQGADGLLSTDRVSFVYSEVTFDEADDVHTNFFKVRDYLTPRGFRFVALYEQYVHENLLGASYTNALFANPGAFNAPR